MTEKQFMDLQQLLDAALLDNNRLSARAVQDLQLAVNTELYNLRLKKFIEAVDNLFPSNTDAEKGTEKFNKFYDLEWCISIGAYSVTVHNEDVVYNGILDTLKDVVDAYCE